MAFDPDQIVVTKEAVVPRGWAYHVDLKTVVDSAEELKRIADTFNEIASFLEERE